MKKLLGIVVLGLLLSGITYADFNQNQKYALCSLNKNIIEHGWKIKSKRWYLRNIDI